MIIRCNSRPLNKLAASIALIAFGVVFFMAGKYSSKELAKYTDSVSAKILTCILTDKATDPEEDDEYSVEVSYTYKSKSYTCSFSTTNEYTEGDTVMMYVNPGDPSNAKEMGAEQSKLFLYVFCGIGIVAIIAGIILVLIPLLVALVLTLKSK